MFISMDYTNYIGSKIKYKSTVDESVKGRALALITLDVTNVFVALTELKEVGSKAVFLYNGTPDQLRDIDVSSFNFVLPYDLTGVEQGNLAAQVHAIFTQEFVLPQTVTYAFHISETIKDMRLLLSLCQQYPNARFLGTDMLSIEGLNRGYVDWSLEMTGKPTTELVFNGNYPILEYTADLELEAYGESTKPKIRVPRIKKEKIITEKKVKEPKEEKEKKPKEKQKPKTIDLSFM